jgi:Replication-relaxation
MRLFSYSRGTRTTISARLAALEKAGYTLSLYLPRPVRLGAPLKVHHLARKGLNHLHALGLDVHPRFHPSEEAEKSYLFLMHTLAVNDFLISCKLIEKTYPAITLHNFIHERTLKRQEIVKVSFQKYTSEGTKVLDKDGKPLVETHRLVPDGFLDFRIDQEDMNKSYRYCLLLELDRATIEEKRFKSKIRALLTLVKDETLCKKHYSAKIPTIAIANAVGGEKRREQLRSWAEQELKKTKEPHFWTSVFLFADVSEKIESSEQLVLDPIWYTPFSKQPVVLLSAGSR